MMAEPATLRRVACIERWIGHEVVLLLPAGSDVRRLAPTAALVWHTLAQAATEAEIHESLAQQYPQVPDAERRNTIDEILRSLRSDGLLESD